MPAVINESAVNYVTDMVKMCSAMSTHALVDWVWQLQGELQEAEILEATDSEFRAALAQGRADAAALRVTQEAVLASTLDMKFVGLIAGSFALRVRSYGVHVKET
jgi:hypothetical protein